MLESLVTAAITLATILGTKELEKKGEFIGESLINKVKEFYNKLTQASPQTVAVIEGESRESLNYVQAVLEMESILANDQSLAESAQELVTVYQENEPIPEVQAILEEISTALKAQSFANPTINNQIEKVVNLAQGQGAKIEIKSQTVNL